MYLWETSFSVKTHHSMEMWEIISIGKTAKVGNLLLDKNLYIFQVSNFCADPFQTVKYNPTQLSLHKMISREEDYQNCENFDFEVEDLMIDNVEGGRYERKQEVDQFQS